MNYFLLVTFELKFLFKKVFPWIVMSCEILYVLMAYYESFVLGKKILISKLNWDNEEKRCGYWDAFAMPLLMSLSKCWIIIEVLIMLLNALINNIKTCWVKC